MHINYITTGKIYDDIKEYIQELPNATFGEYAKNKASWNYVEFGNKLKTWSKFRRCIFTQLKRDENGQHVIGFGSLFN